MTALATFDGTTIAAGYSDGTVRIFDIEKGDVLVVLRYCTNLVYRAIANPNNVIIITVGRTVCATI